MNAKRYLAAAVLLAVFLWFDIAVKGEGVAESLVPVVIPLAVIFLGRLLVRRIPSEATAIVWVVVLVVCSAINLLQLRIHDEWFKWLVSGVTIGALVVMFTSPGREKTELRTIK